MMKWPFWVELTSNMAHLLAVINSSVNFYIYLFKHPTILPFYKKKSSPRNVSILPKVQTTMNTQVLDDRHVEMALLNGKSEINVEDEKTNGKEEQMAQGKMVPDVVIETYHEWRR